jgi:hypothetical protein
MANFIANQSETSTSQPNDHSELRRWIEAQAVQPLIAEHIGAG